LAAFITIWPLGLIVRNVRVFWLGQCGAVEHARACGEYGVGTEGEVA
jgi:hypothetical protein